ncbi:MAG: PAS domain S-box protein [Pseudomonadota bacterium]
MEKDLRTKRELIDELDRTRRRLAELERRELEWKRVEEDLVNSETKFGKITEKSIVGVYLIQDDLFRYVNPKMADIFGYQVDELVDLRGPEDVVHDDDWPVVGENLRMRISGEMQSINYGFRGVKKCGKVIHIEVYGSRTDFRGRPAVIGTILDVTHRVEAELNLQAQLHRFQVLYRIAMAMTSEHTLEENLSLLIEQCRELLGADVSLIAVSDGHQGRLRVRAQAGLRRSEPIDLPCPFLAAQERDNRGNKITKDPETCFRMLKTLARKEFRGEGLNSGIAIPLRLRERNLGILYAANRSKRSFFESEKDTLSLMANMAALEITRKQAEEAVAQSENQMRHLSIQLLKAQEDERKRLAQELHDGIGQSLSAIKFRLETAAKQCEEDPAVSNGRVPLGMLVSMIRRTIEEVRQIAMDLRPSILDDLGLVATFSWFLREFQNTYCDMKVEKVIRLDENDVPEPIKIVIFRVAQEALNNVAKHSSAGVVQVALKKRRGLIELAILDDGKGFDRDPVRLSRSHGGGFGLAGMKERTELSGGVFHLTSEPGQGTAVKASWPLKAPPTYR